MDERTDIWRGSLALMVPRTLEVLGPLPGYGLVRNGEQNTASLVRFLTPAEEA